jgi:hypothetical protein
MDIRIHVRNTTDAVNAVNRINRGFGSRPMRFVPHHILRDYFERRWRMDFIPINQQSWRFDRPPCHIAVIKLS